MELQTWKIQGRSFHFGVHGIGEEETRITWPSDSLFAALVDRLVTLHGADALADWHLDSGNPPFLLTSTFPYAGDVRFFPVPQAALRPKGNDDLSANLRPKDLKKVRFVSEGIYRLLLDGKPLSAILGGEQVLPIQGKTACLLKKERNMLPFSSKNADMECEEQRYWNVTKRPRVAVDRIAQSSNIFHVGAVHFADRCGLWFGVQWLRNDPEQRALLKSLLEDLRDAGLGAERSAGYGAAQKISETEPLNLPDPVGMWTTLSRYLPAEDEILALQAKESAYQIMRVGGWMDKRGLRRRTVHLLQEGAVLGPIDKPIPYGSIADTRPNPKDADEDFRPVEHPVWRSGLAVVVGYGGDTA